MTLDERGRGEALLRLRIVEHPDLQWHEPLVAEVDRLLELARAELPEVEPPPVAPLGDVLGIEARLVRVGLAELGGHEHVLARLVPEVVAELRPGAAVLPAALDLERARIEAGEAARGVAVGVAEHREDDVVTGHAVDRVRARVSGRARDLLGLDHVLDPRTARVVGHVEHVDARRAEARHHEMRAVGPVARRAAAVPAEVVQLVAGVGHRRLVNDPPILGIDHGEEVGCPHAGALVHAGDVQELLGRRAHRVSGRGIERR